MNTKSNHELTDKKKRAMFSFEAEPDVERMLERSKGNGIKLRHTCNNALRVYLQANGFARKKEAV